MDALHGQGHSMYRNNYDISAAPIENFPFMAINCCDKKVFLTKAQISKSPMITQSPNIYVYGHNVMLGIEVMEFYRLVI